MAKRGLYANINARKKKGISRSKKKSEQYWERQDLPKALSRIQSIFQWNEMSSDFKDRWVDYIESEFDYRENGMWFMSNGKPVYITGAHYMYLQWTRLTLELQTLERQTDYSLYSGKPAKLIRDAMGCATLKTVVQVSRLCHQLRQLT